MLWQHSKPRPRWFKTDGIIEHWLKERQTLLVLYNEVCSLSLMGDHCDSDTEIALRSFCQILIDYVSAGHFEIFEKLAEAERESSSTAVLNPDLLIKILRTTNIALEFNEKHSGLKNLDRLPCDLSRLGEEFFAKRLDWEDELIRKYWEVTNTEAVVKSPRAPSL